MADPEMIPLSKGDNLIISYRYDDQYGGHLVQHFGVVGYIRTTVRDWRGNPIPSEAELYISDVGVVTRRNKLYLLGDTCSTTFHRRTFEVDTETGRVSIEKTVPSIRQNGETEGTEGTVTIEVVTDVAQIPSKFIPRMNPKKLNPAK